MFKKIAALATLGLLIGGANRAHADMLYTSESAFLAATSGLTTITFNGIAAPGSFVSYGGGPLTLSGVTFTSNGSMFVIDPAYYGSSYSGGGFLNSDFSSPDVITATLPSGVTAVGANIGGLFGPTVFTLNLSDGSSYVVTTPDSITGTNALDFAGVTTSSPITSITFTTPDAPNYNALDNFVFGSSVATPEPTSLTLLGTGVLTLIGYGWRRKKNAATHPAC